MRWKSCRRNLPNVIVLDIQLPDIDGYEVCRRLRGNLRTSHIPILFLTQRDERSDKIRGWSSAQTTISPSRLTSTSSSCACRMRSSAPSGRT